MTTHAQITIIEDFEDDDLTNPYEWATSAIGNVSLSFETVENGYNSDYCLRGEYNIGSNNVQGVFIGSDFVSAFMPGSDGMVFHAKGYGTWDLKIIPLGSNPMNDPPLFYRFELDSVWQKVFIPWEDFHYPPKNLDRPDLLVENIAYIWLIPQSMQEGRSGYCEIDDLGYFESEGVTENDADGDGVPNAYDHDTDNDGWFDILEEYAGANVLDADNYPESELEIPSTCSYTGIFPLMGWTDELTDFETLTGMKSALIAYFIHGWGDTTGFYHFNTAVCDFIARRGAIPVYQWPILNAGNVQSNPWPVITDSLYRLQSIIDGQHDSVLNVFANEVKDWKMPLFLNPVVEYNQGFTSYHAISNFGPHGTNGPPPSELGDFSESPIADSLVYYCDTVPVDSLCNYYGDPNVPDGPERMKDALLHIKNIFIDAGADNVIWTMQAHPMVDPDYFGSWTALHHVYDDDYVDWHSISAHHGYRNDGVVSLEGIAGNLYDTLMNLNASKPVLIIEFAVHSNAGGVMNMSDVFEADFNQYLTDSMPMVKGWTYANSDRYGTDWQSSSIQIDSSRFQEEINAFVNVAENDCFNKQPAFSGIISHNTLYKSPPYPGLSCFPNPATHSLDIIVDYDDSENCYIGIYTLSGKLVKHIDNIKSVNMHINMSSLKPGVYVVIFTCADVIKGYEKIVITDE